MNKNKGIKILAGSVVFAVVMILINSRHSTPIHDDTTPNPNNFHEAITSQFNDNIRDVSARLLETEKKLEQMHKENKSLQKQLKQPTQEASHTLQDELQTLKEKLSALTDHQTQSYPMEGTQASVSGQIKDLDGLLDKAPIESKIFADQDSSTKEEAPTKTPFYTIPAGSDFSKVTLLSALMGEVPVEGKLMQPLFPFTAMVSRGDLMTANGMQLPEEIIGMKISGYSIGVGSFLDNISCVRAYITAALFVFEDGHFVSIGQEQMKSSAELVNNDSIGYLTTQFGNPCIKGQYITNAPRVLAAFMAAGGIQGAGNALSKWQMSYQAEGGSAIATPTGDLAHFAAGGAINEGSQKLLIGLRKEYKAASIWFLFQPASAATQALYQINSVFISVKP